MNKKPTVGIITRTKNRSVLLRRAIESVTNQTYPHWKLVIVNDGGERESVDALVSLHPEYADQITVIHNPSSVGMEAASNIGLKTLDTDHAVIHDDDDSWAVNFLEQSLTTLHAEQKKIPTIQGIVCYSTMVAETVKDEKVTIDYTEPYNHWIKPGLISLDRMLYENMFPPISFLFSLKVCKELGYFNEALPVLGDWDFHIKFLLKYDIAVLPEFLANYHHRFNATGVMANTVIAGVDKHMLYRQQLLNQWLREDLNGTGTGLGTYINERVHMEYILRQMPYLSEIKQETSAIKQETSAIKQETSAIKQETSAQMQSTIHLLEKSDRIIHFIEKMKKTLKNPFKLFSTKKETPND